MRPVQSLARALGASPEDLGGATLNGMRVGHSYRSNFNDPLLKRRRRVVFVKLAGGILAVMLVSVGVVYGVFFSPLFAIRDVRIIGLDTMDSTIVEGGIRSIRDSRKLFGLIPWGNNSLFFRGDELAERLMKGHPELKSARISSQLFHEVTADFQERKVIGIWCAHETTCVYFDEEGVTWGQAPQSSGSLVAFVQDERQDSPAVDKEFFDAIRRAAIQLNAMGLGVKRARIPLNTISDFRIYTSSDTPIYMSIDTNIEEQLKSLRFFLDQGAPENWHPEYIDLRINGRLYYK